MSIYTAYDWPLGRATYDMGVESMESWGGGGARVAGPNYTPSPPTWGQPPPTITVPVIGSCKPDTASHWGKMSNYGTLSVAYGCNQVSQVQIPQPETNVIKGSIF